MSTDRPTAGGGTVTEDGLQIWSCVTCRRRKVKCDRTNPCSNCARNGVECHFPVTGRLPRRRDPTTWKSPTEKQAELLNRLRRLESLVTELAAQVEDGPDKIQSILPGLLPISAMKSHLEGETNEDFGRLVIGNEAGLQIGKGFWSVFCSEVEHIFEAIQDVASTASNSDYGRFSSSSQITSHNMHPDFYFGNTYTGAFAQSLDDLYPLPSQMLFIWRTYVENVDPFIKVIDVAALDEVVTNLRGKFGSLRYSLQALLFAVCLASITSLGEEEALSCFDMPRTQLLARFRLGTEKALANAGLLVTKEIETIQAFVIYLSILPHIGCQQLLSPFVGLLLRIATSVQLHRDAESFKTPTLTPFEVEIRRRLWWQVIFIDSISRSRHSTGLAASDTMFDTKAPSRISANDQTSSPVSFDVESESLVCIMRCEIWILCRFLNANQRKPLEQKLKAFNLTSSRLEDSYIARLSSNDALESLVKTMTSLAFSKVEHTIYLQHFRNLKELLQMPSQEMVQHHLELSIDILRDAHKVRTEPSWERWRWQLRGDFPWASMSAVFIQLCQSPWSATSERGWALINEILKDVPDRVKENASWGKLNQLITAAEAKRKRNPGEAMNQTSNRDGISVRDPVETQEGSRNSLDSLKSRSHNTGALIGYAESSPVLMPSIFDFGVEFDDPNELGSDVTFNPMEWQVWDEAFVDDDQFWDLDYPF
ncbi:hypothetical protein TRIATDRAFT_214314 [Trichoderma atroviride IMI 206040]|uniref:Zn(2)-C6 fungal-type domain-containing protein n=1 Tax=Hypocrea atroviridis (strain ATCC 20476 / IMI 206040) TaxID=452589 RepID=G9NKD8_HYPAI|nr:uncharacterized protein TRIATDRAFT_214314 [Trichoderma atroviride IMI 206040]EHK49355.1 hypothetical protein TRIATDRAFT_214314 [Trichoderma atroviride IMI 206040]